MRASVVAAIVAAIVGFSSHTLAQASIRRLTAIPPQSLAPALQSLMKERQFQIVYSSELLANRETQGAAGDLTIDEALTQLLSGTGLMYRFLDEQTVTILPVFANRASDGGKSDASEDDRNTQGAQEHSFWDRFRLAEADQGTPGNSPSVEESTQEGADRKSGKLEEVIVTAQKREERLIDVPISIDAVSGDELQKRQVTSLDDLPFVVPDLAIVGDGATRVIVIRGAANPNNTAVALVGVYLDEADVTLGNTSAVSPKIYDLERVEVLRGPQGTLYGEGSAGGTVRFITKNPDPNHFVMTSDVAALFTQDGGPGQRVNAMVNVPLVADELGLRFAGTFSREGGWIDQPAADQKDINSEDLTSVRVKGLWRPAPQFTVSALTQINRDDRSIGIGEDSHGNYEQAFNLTTTPKVEQDEDLYNLTLTYDFPSLRILSATSYLKALQDTRNYGAVNQNGPPEAPLSYSNYYYSRGTSTHFALVEELRLSSLGSGPLQWTAGFFFRHYRNNYVTPDGAYYGPEGLPGEPFAFAYAYGASSSSALYKSSSIFADVSYQLTNRLTFGAGSRYFHDDQEVTNTDLVAQTATLQVGKFHSVDPRAYLRYKLTRQINVYASAAKGFRSGGFNLSSPGQSSLPSFDPESLWSYELGAKMSLLEGRLRLDGAVFTSDYSDIQVLGVSPATRQFLTQNAGDATIKGVDFDATWQPWDRWTLALNSSYLRTRFTAINLTSTAHDVGDALDYVPKYQYDVSAQRDLSFGDKSASLRLDYSQQGPATIRGRSFGPWWYGESDTIRLLNFNASLRWSANLGFGFFVQNLRNDRGYITPSSAFVGYGSKARPRTYGVEFNVAFD